MTVTAGGPRSAGGAETTQEGKPVTAPEGTRAAQGVGSPAQQISHGIAASQPGQSTQHRREKPELSNLRPSHTQGWGRACTCCSLELWAAAVPLRTLHVLGEPAASVLTGWRWTAGGVTHCPPFLVTRFASRQGPLIALDRK